MTSVGLHCSVRSCGRILVPTATLTCWLSSWRDDPPGLIGIAGLEIELSALFGGRKVDLRTPQDLSRYFRQDVLDKAVVQYARR